LLLPRARRYVAAKKPAIGKNKRKQKKEKKKKVPLAEVTFKGFNFHGEYDPAEHTDADLARFSEAMTVKEEWWSQRYNPKYSFEPIEKEGEVEGFMKYSSEERSGMAIAHCYINAAPEQVCISARVLLRFPSYSFLVGDGPVCRPAVRSGGRRGRSYVHDEHQADCAQHRRTCASEASAKKVLRGLHHGLWLSGAAVLLLSCCCRRFPAAAVPPPPSPFVRACFARAGTYRLGQRDPG
jgi:hypothetical protein